MKSAFTCAAWQKLIFEQMQVTRNVMIVMMMTVTITLILLIMAVVVVAPAVVVTR